MYKENKTLKVMVSGGGTGGHIFPAISIANELKRRYPHAEFLFVGAKGRMEMDLVPKAGYNIKGLWISGLQRKAMMKNLSFPFKVISSLLNAYKIIKQFKPDVAVGTGGYASGPTLAMASRLGIPTLVQEQNSYAGITNKLLSKHVTKICVAYDKMDRFFPKEKIVITGNPIRAELLNTIATKEAAREYFGLDSSLPTVLFVGGSLGARTFNDCIAEAAETLANAKFQVIWQIGSYYFEAYKDATAAKLNNVKPLKFIDDMSMAYRASDLVVSRAGGSISEMAALGKSTLLVPSPNVAEDHQTKNAMALVENNATILVKDSNAGELLMSQVDRLITDQERLAVLSSNILKMAKPNATASIVNEIENII